MRSRPAAVSCDSPVSNSTSLASAMAPAGGVDRGGDVRLAQCVGQIGDDLRAARRRGPRSAAAGPPAGPVARQSGTVAPRAAFAVPPAAPVARPAARASVPAALPAASNSSCVLLAASCAACNSSCCTARSSCAAVSSSWAALSSPWAVVSSSWAALRALFFSSSSFCAAVRSSCAARQRRLLAGDVRLALLKGGLQYDHLVAALLVVVVHEEVLVEYIEQDQYDDQHQCAHQIGKAQPEAVLFACFCRARPRREVRLMRMPVPPYCRSWGCGG